MSGFNWTTTILALTLLASQTVLKSKPKTYPKLGHTVDVRIIRVLDGDTVEVEFKHRAKVRLLDCWAPETRTKDLSEKRRGILAKRFLTGLAEGRDARLEIPGNVDIGKMFSFGRILGDLWLEGNDETLSSQMVNAGHATEKKPKPKLPPP